MMQYRTKYNDVLDAICYRYYDGRLGATESVLEANPGLANQGPLLPAGLIIQLPELPAAQPAAAIRLWD